VQSYFNDLPLNRETGPFSMTDEKSTLEMLEKADFSYSDVDQVKKAAVCQTAADVAKGFILGLPIYTMIIDKNPAVLDPIQETLTEALADELGDNPLHTSLQAWVFDAIK
jgi:hypothetical protein